MTLIELKKIILEAIRFYGQLSIRELLYLFFEDPEWIVKILKHYDTKKLFKSKIFNCLKILVREEHIREYFCDSGYRRRYGIPELDLPNKIPLKLKEYPTIKNCRECYFPVIIYKDKKKHILQNYCNERNKEGSNVLKIILMNKDIRFVVYKSMFLGVLEKNKIRLPFKDNKNHIPEFFIALNKYRSMNGRINLRLKFKEVVV